MDNVDNVISLDAIRNAKDWDKHYASKDYMDLSDEFHMFIERNQDWAEYNDTDLKGVKSLLLSLQGKAESSELKMLCSITLEPVMEEIIKRNAS